MFSGFKSSYYLKPEENRIPLGEIPMMPKFPNMNNLSKEENRKAKEVCQEHKALPQSSTRTFTSKFKAGTLPLQAYLTANVEAETDPNSLGGEIQSESVPDSPVMNDAFVDEPPEWDSDSSAEDDVTVRRTVKWKWKWLDSTTSTREGSSSSCSQTLDV